MHPELERWLDDVWGQHKTMLRRSRTGTGYDMKKLAAQAYSTYCKSLLKQEKATKQDLVDFLGQLAKLETTLKAVPTLQSKTDRVRFQMGEMTEYYRLYARAVGRPLARQPLNTSDELALEDGADILKAFIHYRHGLGKQACSERVYLNVKRFYRVSVFKHVLGPLYCGSEEFDGLVSAKLKGPMDDDRADNIVVYTKDKASSDRVVKAVKDFQAEGYKYCFGAETPRTTSKVPDLIGVSTGTEPPRERIELTSSGRFFTRSTSAQSFGSTRAKMIAQAMVYVDKHPAGLFASDKTKFKETVAKLFRKAGINPDNPAEQNYNPSPSLKRINSRL
jgi:hypothetical protein